MIMVRAARVLGTVGSIGVCLALAMLVGCGGESSKAVVTGKVTYKGAPLTGGTLTLYPASGSAYPVGIKSDGTFIESDIPLGPMGVGIATGAGGSSAPGAPVPPGYKPTPAGTSDPSKMPKAESAPVVNIPAKYMDPKTSGLTWDIKGGKNTKDFDLID